MSHPARRAARGAPSGARRGSPARVGAALPWRTIGVVASLVGGIGLIAYAVFSGTSDEERIRELLAGVERVAAIQPGDNVATRALRLRGELAELFEKEVKVEFEETGSTVTRREELIGLVAQADAAVETLDARFTGIDISVDGTGATARATGKVVVSAVRPGGELERAEREVRFQLAKGGDGWRISRAQVRAPEDSGE